MPRRLRKTIAFFAISALLFSDFAEADPNYHLLGWINAVVPGAGVTLMGRPVEGAAQASLEIGTFMWGFNLSPQAPITLDGVPQDLPVAQSGLKTYTSSKQVCVKFSGGHCVQYATITTSKTQSYSNTEQLDATKPAYAAILQEFGIKYHLVNVFNAYREAAAKQGGTEYAGLKIDMRSTGDMFLDPFRAENVFSPWVIWPLLAIAGFTALDYRSQTVGGQAAALQPMTPGTNRLIAFNFIAWQPIGSGAPEEMFYRGFVQNEAYHMVASPFFSIPASTAAFAFSHAPSGRPTAAVAGGYLGFLAHKNHGNLAQGIALHFWGVVILGLETYFLTRYAEKLNPNSATVPVSAMFEF